MLKNWCLRIVVLEKTPENHLRRLTWGDQTCKDIKPVNPIGNQPWIFIGRTDAEALILWPSDVKNQLIGKTLMLGKFEGRRRRGWQKMRWFDGITDSMDMNLSKLQEMVKDREVYASCSPCGCNLWVHEESDTTEWTTKVMIKFSNFSVSSFYNWWNSTALSIGILIWEYIVNGLKKRKFKEL